VDFAGTLLTQSNTESLVTIHFNEAVTGFGPDDLTVIGGTVDPGTFQQIDADTYTAKFLVQPNFEGTGQVILTGAYTDLAGNPGITGADDTIAINTLASTLDATILTTGTSGLGQTVELTFVDLQNPMFSYAGLYDLGAQGGAFQRDAGFDIDPSRDYAVSLEATGGTPVPVRVLTVEGVTIHVIDNVVQLQLDNDDSTLLTQTALTSIIQPSDPFTHQPETASVDGNADANNGMVASVNTFDYLYGADGSDTLSGNNFADVLNGGAGNDKLIGGTGNDILVYDPVDQKIDGGDGFDLLRTDEAALGLLNNVGVTTDAATGFSVVEVVPFKQNIKNIEGILITDDAGSSPTKGGLLNLTAQDVLDMTDSNHTLSILGNQGDVVNLGIGASAWNDTGKALDASGFYTYTQTFEGINLILKIEHNIVVH
jgi:Ca2+-binding RTX toxin-like protein